MKNLAAVVTVIGYLALTVVTTVVAVRHPTNIIDWVLVVAVVGLGVGACWSAQRTSSTTATNKKFSELADSGQHLVDKLGAQIAAPQASRIEPSSDIRQMGVAVGQMVASLQQDGGLTRAEAVQFAASLCRSNGGDH